MEPLLSCVWSPSLSVYLNYGVQSPNMTVISEMEKGDGGCLKLWFELS